MTQPATLLAPLPPLPAATSNATNAGATSGVQGQTVLGPASAGQFCFERGDHVELADAALEVLRPLAFADGAYWAYDAGMGIWVRTRVEKIRNTIASFAGMATAKATLKIKSVDIRGAEGVLRDSLLASGYAPDFSSAPAGLAFANGFVTVSRGSIVLGPHGPDNLARFAHPFDWVRGLAHPKLDRFFDEVFGDVPPSERLARAGLVQEFVGACLIGEATKYQKCLVLAGEGNNGKSQLLVVLRALMPRGTTISLPPQKWAQRFQIAELAGALANFVDEIPENDITGGEVFKSVITGEPITGERKYEQPFDLRPRAGHIFSANTLPGTVDHSGGFWRRFLVCPFNVDMKTLPTLRPDVGQEIVDAELPAIIAWALEGAARVQLASGYSVPPSSAAAVHQWMVDADPVRRFVETACNASAGMTCSGARLYDSFRLWSDQNGHKAMSSQKFLKRLSSIGVKPTHTKNGNVYSVVPKM